MKRETLEEALENDCPGDCRPEDHCGEHSEIVHQCPPDGSGITPCCGRPPIELPGADRMTVDLTRITCGRPAGRGWSSLPGPEADPRPMPAVEIPAHLLEGALADARCQRDRARGEDALCAPPGSPLARVGDNRVAMWSARNAGLIALLEWAGAR